MAGDNRSPTSIAFGDYRLSLYSFELRKHGLKVRLRQLPARVLAALAGKSGEIVKREELQRELWKDHTFVDFESGLNNCIKQIRAALNDDLGDRSTSRRSRGWVTASWLQCKQKLLNHREPIHSQRRCIRIHNRNLRR